MANKLFNQKDHEKKQLTSVKDYLNFHSSIANNVAVIQKLEQQNEKLAEKLTAQEELLKQMATSSPKTFYVDKKVVIVSMTGEGVSKITVMDEVIK